MTPAPREVRLNSDPQEIQPVGGTKVCAPEADPRIGEAAIMQAKLGVDCLEESKRQFGIADLRQEVFDDITTQCCPIFCEQIRSFHGCLSARSG